MSSGPSCHTNALGTYLVRRFEPELDLMRTVGWTSLADLTSLLDETDARLIVAWARFVGIDAATVIDEVVPT